MPTLALKIVVVGLAALAMIQFIGEWIVRRNRQKRDVALKTWIHTQDKRQRVVYRKVQIHLAQQRQSD